VRFPRGKFWWLAAALALVLLVGLLGRSRRSEAWERRIARYRAAGLPTTFAELDAQYPPIPDGENAGILLVEAGFAWRPSGNTNLPTDSLPASYPRQGQAWSAGMMKATREELEANADSLAQIHAALERPRSYYPVLRGGVYNGSHRLPLRKAFENLILEARYAAEIGDSERAVRAIIAALRAARTLEEEPLFNGYSFRILLGRRALEAAEAALSRTRFTDDQLGRLQAACILAEATGHLGRVLVGERVLKLEALHDSYRTLLLSSSPPVGWQDHLEAVVLDLGDFCGLKQRDIEYHLDRLDELAEAAALPRSAAPTRQRQFVAKLQELFGMSSWLHPLAMQERWRLQQILPTELGWLARLRSARTASAIERWRLAHGGILPASLNELVPGYLVAVPEDPMDGKPLRYRPRSPAPGYVVYGIGEDGVDDGGKERGPGLHQDKGDHTFTVAR
jgi:hypothetical protein